jgi:hypothetical protein
MAEQIEFRGQARERGFNPIQLSTGKVDAILQQGAGLSRQLRENQDIESRNRNAFQAGQEAAQRLEAANRSRNFELSESAEAAAQRATEQNLRTRIANAEGVIRNQPADDIMPLLTTLSKFSNTIFKQISERRKAQEEAEMEQGYVDQYLIGQQPQDAALLEQGVTQLRQQDEIIQRTADNMRDTGAQPESVEAVRKLSKGQELGRALARADMAVSEWPRFLQQSYEQDQTEIQFTNPATGETKVITPVTAQGPDELAAVNSVLFRRFIKDRGLMGINPKFLGPTLKKMRDAEDSILNRERELFDKARDDERQSEVFFQMDSSIKAGGDAVGSLKEAMRQLSHLRDEKGVIRPLRAFQMTIEHLVKNGDMESLEALEAAESYQPGKTYGELRSAEFAEARRKINSQKASDEDLSDKIEDQNFENWSDQVVSTLNSIEGGADEAQVAQVIEASRQNYNGKVDQRILQYQQNLTLQARTLDESKANVEALAQAGELTIEELDSGKYPLKVRFDANFRRIAEEGSRKSEAISKGLRDVAKPAISAALLANAKITGTTNVRPASFYFAEAHALKQLDKLATNYMNAGKTPEDAYASASRDIVTSIEKDREELTGRKQFGPYSFNDGEFGLFSSKANPAGQYNIAAQDVKNTVSRVRTGGVAAINTEQLIPKHILEQTSDLNAPIPAIANLIANSLPPGKSMSPYDILNAQRRLVGLPPRERDFATQEIENTGDPRLRELINRVPTGARSSRAVVGAGAVGPGQDRQAISFIASQLGVDPVDVATFINYETGGNLVSGAYRRGLDRWGGDGGQYLGWIQFSPDNQRKYGVRPGMTSMQMAQAVVNYMKASGVRRGDGIHVLYQAVQGPAYTAQARATGKNFLSDSNGPVSTHVARMQKDHRSPAAAWLGQGARQGGSSNPYRDDRLMSASARRQLSQVQITSPMGMRNHPVRGGQRFHEGVDYATESNSRLSLKVPGTVDYVGNDPRGYGNFVDIRMPDGAIARFAHLNKVNVKVGQKINPKKVFALTGNTGGSTGPHLHLERRINDKPVDPRSMANLIYSDI